MAELAARAFPDGRYKTGAVEGWMSELLAQGVVQKWTSDGREYGHWVKWLDFHKPDTRIARKTPEPPVPQQHQEIPMRSHEIPEDPARYPRRSCSSSCSSSSSSTQEQRFGMFWKSYPKKKGKGAARKAWMKHKPPDKIHKTLEAYKRTEQWKKDGGQYIPYPATFINEGRWDDEPEAVDSGVPLSPRCGCQHPKNAHQPQCIIAACGCKEYKP